MAQTSKQTTKGSKKTISQDLIDEIKKQATSLSQNAGSLTSLYKRYEEIYFMTGGDKPKTTSIDSEDWKVTVSPNGRNAVTGMKRLLDTSEIHVKVTTRGGDKAEQSDKIEKGLLHMLAQSGMLRRARVEKDLNLSAVLYGPAILAVERMDDLIAVQKNPASIARLERMKETMPFVFKALPPAQSFSRWGDFGMMAHLRKYKLRGDAVRERWGVENLSFTTDYQINDWIDLENRLVWIEGVTEPVLAKPHGMPSMNISARFAGGSSLFDESDKQMQSFLYAHTKGEWDKRENLFWTYLFTALFMQGLPGPLMIVDPESVAAGQNTLEVDYTGGIRKVFAKAQMTDYPVIDGDVLKIKDLMDAVNADSTIYKQTLGQNIEASTFSGLAMLSSAGQLPLEDAKEAIGFTFRDSFDHILQRIKNEGVDNALIKPSDIPDDYEIEVTQEPKLPQDNLRNAQTATGLGDLVSDEWKLQNLLQVGDSKAMRKQVAKEQLLKGMLSAMMQDQQLVMEIINQALGRQPQQPPTVAGGENGPASPETAIPAGADGSMMQGPAATAGANMMNSESIPATSPQPMGMGGPSGMNGGI